MNMQKIKRRSAYILFTAAVIVCIILVNVIAGIVTESAGLSLDLSQEGLYSLSDKTRSALEAIERPVSIHVLMDEVNFASTEPYVRIYEVLNRYENAAQGMLTVSYVDIYKNPGFAGQYSGASDLNEGSLIVESELRYRVIPITNLFVLAVDPTTYASTVQGLNAEQPLTSAINYVANPQVPSAQFVLGHNEKVESGLTMVLENMNYTVSELNLTTGTIPAETDLLIIDAPQADYTAGELELLDAFLSDGGDVIVFMDAESPELPELAAFFAEWGVVFEPTIVFDPSRSASTNPMQVYTLPTAHDLNDSIIDNETLLLTPASRSLHILWEARSGITVEPVIRTSEHAYAKPYTSDGLLATYEQEAGDKTGVQTIGVLSEKAIERDGRTEYGRILFIGNTYIANESFVSSGSLLNSDFISGAANYLTDEGNQIFIPSKNYYSEQLVVVGATQSLILWVFIVAIPALILGAGILEWYQRRHR